MNNPAFNMRLSSIFTIAATFVVAAVLCLITAGVAVGVIEDHTRTAVRETLKDSDIGWAEVDANGLQVFLGGTAPNEAMRLKAITVAGTVVDTARVINQMEVADAADIAPPRFSVEVLRHDKGVSLIGLIPAATDRKELITDIAWATNDAAVADLLESADYQVPENWTDALDYAIRSLKLLDRAKISVDAQRVVVTAMADSETHKAEIETKLARTIPDGLGLKMNISAPRPVITPFTLRFVITDGQARFDACSADTEEARNVILSAAGKAGLRQNAECAIGLGVPSPKWSAAASQAILALGQLGGGSVTFSDADISLVAAEGTTQQRFDDIVGGLENALPDVFALHAVLPVSQDGTGPVRPEFVATLSPEGLVQLRGRVASERARDTVDSFAKARFTSDSVHTTARIADGLPADWPLRVLAGLETLSYLSNGAVTVTPDMIRVAGNTGRKDANTLIAQFLADKLGDTDQYQIDITYREALDPVASIPTPDECEEMIGHILSERKINFEPGSDTVDAAGEQIIDDISEILKECGEIRMEIGGHTDSQGREIMNQQLSQSRAHAVLNGLRERRVLTSSLKAKGYGETKPIADNDSEDGREANRRIEFILIRPKPVQEVQTSLESMEEPVEDDALAETPEQEQE